MRFKHKKTKKYRGSTYHGWGKGAAHHKGAGSRGGRGRSGSGKKADQKKPSFWKEEAGKTGFNSNNRMNIKALNIIDVISELDWLVENGFASKDNGGFQVDLVKAGYDKLLGSGNAGMKLNITVDFASAKAVAKIKAAGGSVTVLKKIEKKKKKETKKAEKPAKKAAAEDSDDE